MKIRFDGKEFDKGSDEHIAALEAKLDGLPAVTKERDTLQAKFDAADATIKDLTTKLDAANDPKRLDAAINERVALVVKATKVLGSEAKFDGLSVREIMTAVVSKTHPAVKLDGKSDDYVSALFDTAVESGFRADGIQGFDVALRTVQSEAARTDADDESKKEAEYENKRQTRATGKLEFSK